MHVTVAICTWNRARLLDRTLTELSQLQIPPGVDWELLVVNNRCTDDTEAVLERHASRLPLRRLYEPVAGLSHARNCAIDGACGELVLWTDDDVLVDPGWLAAYVAASERWPQASYFGGTIDPWFEVPPPRWIQDNLPRLATTFALKQRGPAEEAFPPEDGPFGANMAFRAGVFASTRFDPELGVNAGGKIGGEEFALVERLRRAGHTGVWVAGARVRHFLPASRLTARSVWEWSHGQGRSLVRMNLIRSGAFLWGAPRWVWRQYWQARLQACLLVPFKGTRWLEAFKTAAMMQGILAEYRHGGQKVTA